MKHNHKNEEHRCYAFSDCDVAIFFRAKMHDRNRIFAFGLCMCVGASPHQRDRTSIRH